MSFQHDILAATQAFNANLHMLAQQQVSKLQDAVRVETMTTKSEFFDRVGGIRMLPRTSRHADTAFTPLPFSRRRVDAFDYEVSDLIDAEDVQKALVNPQSATTTRFLEAGKINMDRVIFNAALGNAVSTDSEFAVTNVALPAGQKIANGGTNMNTSKIKDGLKILGNNDVDLAKEQPVLAVNWNMYRVLLSTAEFINRDYKLSNFNEPLNAQKAMQNLSEFLGVEIRIVAKELTPKSGNIGSAILFTKNSIVLGVNNMYSTKVLEDATKGGSLRVIGKQSIGAVRMEEEKVVQIDCDETATS